MNSGQQRFCPTMLARYLILYNEHLPQRALSHRAPWQALHAWRKKKAHLYLSNVRKIRRDETVSVLAPDATKDSPKLETIAVTASIIRRVDIETTNPVITIDKSAMQRFGKQMRSDLIQTLPAITGQQATSRMNNDDGSGAAGVSLRGLVAARTLVRVDGHRTSNRDVNLIPANVSKC